MRTHFRISSRLLALAVCLLSAAGGASAAPAVPAATPALDEERLDQSGTVITIIFDDSGSMEGAKIRQAKEAFTAWLAEVPDNDTISLVTLNAGQLVAWKRGNREEVRQAVGKIGVGGGTPLAATMAKQIALITERQKTHPYERHILLAFTDGMDTSDAGAAGVQKILAAAGAARIETVGIGFHGEGDYMAKTATRYFDASSATELKRSLDKVAAEIGDTSDVKIDAETLALMEKGAAGPAPTAPVSSPVPPDPGWENHPPAPSGIGVKSLLIFAVVAIILLRVVVRIFK